MLLSNNNLKKKYLVLIKDFKSEKGNKGEVKSALKKLNSNNVTILHELNELGVIIIETTENFANKIAESRFVESVEEDSVISVEEKLENSEEANRLNLEFEEIKAEARARAEANGESLDEEVDNEEDSEVSSVVSANSVASTQWKDSATEFKNFWNAGFKGQNVRVAVLDSGYTPHPDLEGQVIESLEPTNRTGHTLDGRNHGTPAMGVIGAKEGAVYEGYAPSCKMGSIKIYDDSGNGNHTDFAIGIDYVLANKHKYDIAMFNVQGYNAVALTTRALRLLRQNGIVVVVAGGNYGHQTNASSLCPAFPAREVEAIAIGAIEGNLTQAYYSCGSNNGEINFGATTNLNTTSATGGVYWGFAGTSCATPSAAGMFALLKSAYPHFGVIPLHALMKKGARTDFSTYNRNYFGDGFMRLTTNMLPSAVYGTYNGVFNSANALGDFSHSNGVYALDASQPYASRAIGLPIKCTTQQNLTLELMSLSSNALVEIYLNGQLREQFYPTSSYTSKTISLPVGNNSVEIKYNNQYESHISNTLYVRNINVATPVADVAPSTPTVSLVSVNGKRVTIRTTVPSSSVAFNKVQFDYRWVSGANDHTATMSATRSYDYTFEAPNFNTAYQIDVRVANGTAFSGWSNILSFTTGANTTPVAPSTPTLTLVSLNGLTATIRVDVPSASAPFNKLQFDRYWISGISDLVVTMGDTRSYTTTVTVPNFDTTYNINVMAFNGDLSSSWSNLLALRATSGSNVILEDFSDNTFMFNFTGNWYRDASLNTFRSATISHGQTSTTTFNVDGGSNGATLNLDYMVSTEASFDKFNVYINDTLMFTDSGDKPYQNLNINMGLRAGSNTVKLEYVKDGSVSYGQDAVWVDNIKVTKH